MQNMFLYIRLCIFLSTSVCVGLQTLLWALHFLHLNRKIRGRISAFILLLLLNDLMQLLLHLYSLVQIFTENRPWFPELLRFWSSLSLGGFLLHQLVALEGVLTLKYPLLSAHVFSLPCYAIICIIVIDFSISNHFLHAFEIVISSFSLCATLASLFLLVVTFTITCKAPPTPAIRNTYLVFTVAMVTFVMVYFPFMLLGCLGFLIDFNNISFYEMSVCLLSLRVISDPLLCILVCIDNLRDVSTLETHTEPNADQTSG